MTSPVKHAVLLSDKRRPLSSWAHTSAILRAFELLSLLLSFVLQGCQVTFLVSSQIDSLSCHLEYSVDRYPNPEYWHG